MLLVRSINQPVRTPRQLTQMFAQTSETNRQSTYEIVIGFRSIEIHMLP